MWKVADRGPEWSRELMKRMTEVRGDGVYDQRYQLAEEGLSSGI